MARYPYAIVEKAGVPMLKIRKETCLSCTLVLIGMCFLFVPGIGQGRAQGRSARSIASSQKSSSFTGTYTRIKRRKDENQSATLDIKQIGDSRIKFALTALWWAVSSSNSPHNGEITATIALRNQVAVYKASGYRLTMQFRGHRVVLTERGSNPEFGVNVSAAGTYRRTARDR